jgi:lipopolysaccharide O-acetyltransferase
MIKRYGILGSFRLLMSLIYTKIFYKKARLIRLPFDVRNTKNIDFGTGLTTGFGCRIEAFPLMEISNKIIKFGNNVEINDYVHIAAREKVCIGNNVLIASKVYISDINHGNYKDINQDSPLVKPNERKLSTSPVVISDNVWIGEGVCVMPGVTIGFGCVIGALSIVTKNIPDYSIAVGSPAVVIKKYDFDSEQWIAHKP